MFILEEAESQGLEFTWFRVMQSNWVRFTTRIHGDLVSWCMISADTSTGLHVCVPLTSMLCAQLYKHLLFIFIPTTSLSVKSKWFLFQSITQQTLFLKYVIRYICIDILHIYVCVCVYTWFTLQFTKRFCIWSMRYEKIDFDSYPQLWFHSGIVYITSGLMMTIKASNYM